MTTQRFHPPFDPEVEAFFAAESSAQIRSALDGAIGLRPDGIARMREASGQGLPTDEELSHGGRVDVEDRMIPGPAGAPDVPALILRPRESHGPRPCLYYTCNGGKIIRSNRFAILDMTEWIIEFGAVGVFVAPRVGPEDPHPAQVEDGYAGLVWTAEHAAELGIDPERITIIGRSGGGGIAAATALLARDRQGPSLAHQVLIYPMLDDREITVSSKFEGLPWDRISNQTGWSAILGDKCGGPDVSPYAAPSRATDLTGLPPAYLDTGSSEIFRDETIDYAARLNEAGVPTELHVWAGAFHGSELAVDTEVTRAAVAARHSYMRRALDPVIHRPPSAATPK